MKNNSTKLTLLILFILCNNIYVLGQQPPGIRSSTISFSDIAKYSSENPEISQQKIGNDFGEKEEEMTLPTYKIVNPSKALQDPYGVMESMTNKNSGGCCPKTNKLLHKINKINNVNLVELFFMSS